MQPQSHSSHATDANFQDLVLKRSLDVPVLLNCWSPRFESCAALSASLEALAVEYAGRFELVHVNADEAPQVAMSLRLQSLPTVYLIKQGQPTDGFVGPQTETQIRQLLDRHVEPPAYDPIEAAKDALAEGDTAQAAAHYRALLADQPKHGEALLGMARLALTEAGVDAAEQWLEQIPEEDAAFIQATRLRGVIAFQADAGDIDALRAKLDGDAGDVEAWYRLGASLAVANEFEGAFKAFLEVVKRDREYREDAGRKALLSLFDLLGTDDPAVISARRQLACFLF